jgi:hypothetical protein
VMAYKTLLACSTFSQRIAIQVMEYTWFLPGHHVNPLESSLVVSLVVNRNCDVCVPHPGYHCDLFLEKEKPHVIENTFKFPFCVGQFLLCSPETFPIPVLGVICLTVPPMIDYLSELLSVKSRD